MSPHVLEKEHAVLNDARHAISSRDSHIWTLRIVLVMSLVIVGFLVFVIYQRQSDITIHVPPNIAEGAMLRPGQLHKPNVYIFAVNVWTGLNEWLDSGKTDYDKSIEKYTCQITPDFERWLRLNRKEKINSGELDRTRTLTEIVPYDTNFVSELNPNIFNVVMVMRLQERIGGMIIKDVSMNYSLKVIPDHRHCNDYGMAIAGFVVDPTRAEQDAEAASRKSRK
jgi:integrating conjugative element protein (TIGR03746 family)